MILHKLFKMKINSIKINNYSNNNNNFLQIQIIIHLLRYLILVTQLIIIYKINKHNIIIKISIK